MSWCMLTGQLLQIHQDFGQIWTYLKIKDVFRHFSVMWQLKTGLNPFLLSEDIKPVEVRIRLKTIVFSCNFIF